MDRLRRGERPRVRRRFPWACAQDDVKRMFAAGTTAPQTAWPICQQGLVGVLTPAHTGAPADGHREHERTSLHSPRLGTPTPVRHARSGADQLDVFIRRGRAAASSCPHLVRLRRDGPSRVGTSPKPDAGSSFHFEQRLSPRSRDCSEALGRLFTPTTNRISSGTSTREKSLIPYLPPLTTRFW
jgi:hypothetical protein